VIGSRLHLRQGCNCRRLDGCRVECLGLTGQHLLFKPLMVCQIRLENRHSNEPPSFSTRIFIQAAHRVRTRPHPSSSLTQCLAASSRLLAASPRAGAHLQQSPVGGRGPYFLRFLTTHDRYKFSYDREFAKSPDSRLSTETVGFGPHMTYHSSLMALLFLLEPDLCIMFERGHAHHGTAR